MTKRAWSFCAAAALALSACSAPKYARYRSVSGDFAVEAPWGWNVVADADHDAFAQVIFGGPFDADFFLGTPSLSVRWYKNYRPHPLQNGGVEMYSGVDDFIRQTLAQVYGPDAVVYGDDFAKGGKIALLADRVPLPKGRSSVDIALKATKLPAKYFAVVSRASARPGTVGAVKDVDGAWHNVRYHEYAVVPMPGGFYVLCYPATMKGHDKGFDRFLGLIGSFHPYTDGPGGPKVVVGPDGAKVTGRPIAGK